MESIARHRTGVEVKVYQTEQPYSMSLLPRPSYSPNSPPTRILLDFVLQNLQLDVFQPCDRNIPGRVTLQNPQLPFPGTHEFVDSDTVTSPSSEIRQIIIAKISELVPDGFVTDYEAIVHEVGAVSRIACSNPSNVGRETIPIRVRIRVVHARYYFEREWIQLVMNDVANAADTRCGMVPSSKKSIQDLRVKKLTSEDSVSDTSCVVCLENFVAGTDLTCMPCEHLFHKNCITSWLEKSHYCPICRFEMPIEDEDEDESEYHYDGDENHNSDLEMLS